MEIAINCNLQPSYHIVVLPHPKMIRRLQVAKLLQKPNCNVLWPVISDLTERCNVVVHTSITLT